MILTTPSADPSAPPQRSRIQWSAGEILALVALLLPLVAGAIGTWQRLAQVEQTTRQMVRQVEQSQQSAEGLRDQVGRIREDIAGLRGALFGRIERR